MLFRSPFTILVTVAFVLMGRDGLITRLDGAILWIGLLVYIGYLLKQAKQKVPENNTSQSVSSGTEKTVSSKTAETAESVLKSSSESALPGIAADTPEAVPEESPSIWKLIAFTIVGLAVILVSSDYAVDAATALAKIFNISDRVIGLTIVALGTSLPELVTSATAALRGNGDLAVGNVIGSCIFNILFVLGSSALIMPIPCASNFLSDAYVAVAATILLLIFGYTQRKIVRWEGLLLLACYIAYAYLAL